MASRVKPGLAARLWRSHNTQQDDIGALRSQLEAISARLSLLDDISSRLNRLEQMSESLARIEQLAHGGRAVFVGNGRILTKASIGGATLGYLMEADDRLIVPGFVVSGIHEVEVTDFFLHNVKPTDHCLDIGANFGYYTCLMAHLAYSGKTIGIEPDQHVFELLRDNIYINGLEARATPMRAAVGAEAGALQLHRRFTRSGNTSITRADYAAALGEPEPEAFEVECIPIDHLLPNFEGRIDCIKIDVEGAEPLVFAGAKETIAGNPDLKIVMEWSPGQIQAAGFDTAQFTRDLEALGLTVALIGAAGAEPATWESLLGYSYLSGVLLVRDAA
jgi:FkbM family methyltransferase